VGVRAVRAQPRWMRVATAGSDGVERRRAGLRMEVVVPAVWGVKRRGVKRRGVKRGVCEEEGCGCEVDVWVGKVPVEAREQSGQLG